MLSQTEWHVTPNGSSSNGGTSIDDAWDLHTALTSGNGVQAGHTIWLHGGTYDGRYVSTISGAAGNEITVASYPGEWAVLNGNVISNKNEVLEILGSNVAYKNFEVTFLGSFSRDKTIAEAISGISHNDGEDCKLINLIVHDNPGNGIGSWKLTGGTEIYGCIVYNNGTANGLQGTALYMQNQSNKIRHVENNVFFNNFRHGPKLWSASSNPSPISDFVKNLDFIDNVVFNTGSPLGLSQECFLLASGSKVLGANIIHDVNVKNNFIAHNFNESWLGIVQEAFRINEIYSDYSNVDLAYNITVEDNYFLGGKQGVLFASVGQGFSFKRNVALTNYVYSYNNYYSNTPGDNNFVDWDFSDNYYFSKFFQTYQLKGFAAVNGGSGNRSLEQMYYDFGMENMSARNHSNSIPVDDSSLANHIGSNNTISLTQNKHIPNQFKIVTYDKDSNDVIVDMSAYGLVPGSYYQLRDSENYFNPLQIETLINNEIVIPMDLTDLAEPKGTYNNNGANSSKSDSRYGAFIVEFVCQPDLLLQDITETSTIEHQSGETIINAGSSTFYNIEANADVTHKAGKHILLEPGFHAKEGSNYTTSIEYCDPGITYVDQSNNSSRTSATAESSKKDEDSEIVKVYPNPTTSSVTIESSERMLKWVLNDHYGRYSLNSGRNRIMKNDQLNISKLPTGIYVLKVTLENGEVVYKNIVRD